jgi:hypothetical protein
LIEDQESGSSPRRASLPGKKKTESPTLGSGSGRAGLKDKVEEVW